MRGRDVCDNLLVMQGFAFFGAVPSSLHSVVSKALVQDRVFTHTAQVITGI